jgi:hypothetical protein
VKIMEIIILVGIAAFEAGLIAGVLIGAGI